jgi:ABC-type sugar transport system ATPase subunit
MLGLGKPPEEPADFFRSKMKFLEVDLVHKYFGGIPALHGVSIEVEEGKVHGVIGPNGAGKSTLLKTIYGYLRPSQGDVLHHGQSINRASSFSSFIKKVKTIPASATRPKEKNTAPYD